MEAFISIYFNFNLFHFSGKTSGWNPPLFKNIHKNLKLVSFLQCIDFFLIFFKQDNFGGWRRGGGVFIRERHFFNFPFLRG